MPEAPSAFDVACRLAEMEREYIHALQQATTYRLLLQTALAGWGADKVLLDRSTARIRELLGVASEYDDDAD